MIDYKSNSKSHRTIYVNMYDPNEETSLKLLKDRDRWAMQSINELQNAIKLLNEYRSDIAARAAFLVSDFPSKRAELVRHRTYSGKITYTFRVMLVYSDNTEKEEYRAEYPGSLRHEAIKEFNRYKKEHPFVPSVMNIEKSKWER